MTDRVHIDFETFSEISLPNHGVSRYTRHPSTDVLMGAWSLNDVKQKQWIPAEGEPLPADLKEALEDPHVIKWAWNAPFEVNVTRNVLGLDTPLESWRDTMVLALTCSLPGKLEKAGPVVDLAEDLRHGRSQGANVVEGRRLQRPPRIVTAVPLEPRRDKLRAKAAIRRDRLEPPPPEEQLAQDQQHRPVAEQLGGAADGTIGVREVGTLGHGPSPTRVIASAAKQSRAVYATLDCFAALAMTNHFP